MFVVLYQYYYHKAKVLAGFQDGKQADNFADERRKELPLSDKRHLVWVQEL